MSANATANIGVIQTIAALNSGAGAVVTLTASPSFFGFGGGVHPRSFRNQARLALLLVARWACSVVAAGRRVKPARETSKVARAGGDTLPALCFSGWDIFPRGTNGGPSA